MSLNRQTRLCCGLVDVVQQQVKRTQGTTLPSFADFAEQALHNGIPFGSAGRIMTDGDSYPKDIRDLFLDAFFEKVAARGGSPLPSASIKIWVAPGKRSGRSH